MISSRLRTYSILEFGPSKTADGRRSLSVFSVLSVVKKHIEGLFKKLLLRFLCGCFLIFFTTTEGTENTEKVRPPSNYICDKNCQLPYIRFASLHQKCYSGSNGI